jgi:hypothetical protein
MNDGLGVGRESAGAGRAARARRWSSGMIRITITAAAFEAIKATLPLGRVGYEAEANERGERCDLA